jgi:hypothetical protein
MSHLFKRTFNVREYLLVELYPYHPNPMDDSWDEDKIKATEMVNAFDASEDWMLSSCTCGDDTNGPYFEWICGEPLRVYYKKKRGFLDICNVHRDVLRSVNGLDVTLFSFNSVLCTDNAHEAAAFIKNYVKKSFPDAHVQGDETRQ